MTGHEHTAGNARFAVMIAHLKKHNEAHSSDLRQRATELETAGFAGAAAELLRAAALSAQIDACFAAAMRKLDAP